MPEWDELSRRRKVRKENLLPLWRALPQRIEWPRRIVQLSNKIQPAAPSDPALIAQHPSIAILQLPPSGKFRLRLFVSSRALPS
jgi:hypothetical protein